MVLQTVNKILWILEASLFPYEEIILLVLLVFVESIYYIKVSVDSRWKICLAFWVIGISSLATSLSLLYIFM